MGTPYKMKGMGFGNTPLKKDIKITTGFGPEADANLSKKVNKSNAKEFLKKNTVKPKVNARPKPLGSIRPLSRGVQETIKKVISKVVLPVSMATTAYELGVGNPKSAKATNKSLRKEARNKLRGINKTHVPKY